MAIYIGIVDSIGKGHSPGIYGHKEPASLDEVWGNMKLLGICRPETINLQKRICVEKSKGMPIKFPTFDQGPAFRHLESPPLVRTDGQEIHNYLLLPHTTMKEGFDTKEVEPYLFDLLHWISVAKRKLFMKELFSSSGGSDLLILEKADADVLFRHPNGGRFSSGIHILHPKDHTILLPLRSAPDYIVNAVLDETVAAFEALGAKKIEINLTESASGNAGASGKFKGFKFSGFFKKSKEVYKLKEFGSGIFDPVRALEGKYFIFDHQSIMNVVQARMKGNQTKELFIEDIKYDAGIDISFLGVFASKESCEYSTRFRFEVDFYDKEEIRQIPLDNH